ncbi:hypothetical protein G5714_004029 [Onychostoma macrolepis]|uniref:Ig-like domain-containing protein n=1 Tax=Onychostoma macrolepis TaxID=369639 RepID=A0A7J6DBB5_9TELE|nr:hypothetical protein G5714_004029 [Onychostoma macrolepis]
MADKGHLCLRGLIFLSSLLTGTSGIDETHVFIKSGENVHLSCNNALPDCKSTHWIYNGISHSETVELTAGGIKKTGIERHERLSLGYNCSLNIMNVTEEDYGSYTCRQYVNDKQQGTDARVSLHVLRVSSSSSQTEISAGRSVTLSCQLYSFAGVSCDRWIHSEGIELFWVNQAGVKLMRSDSRYQISAPGHCISTLNTTLLNEDHNREWRCQLTQGNQVKISATYTVKISAGFWSHLTTTLSPNMITDPGKTELSRTTGSLFREILIILETAVFAAPTVILLQIICARRAGRKNSQHLEEI